MAFDTYKGSKHMKLNLFWIVSFCLGILLLIFTVVASINFFQKNNSLSENTISNNDYNIDTGITPINFRNVIVSNSDKDNGIIKIIGSSEPAKLIVLLNNNERLKQIESNSEGIWEVDVPLDSINIMAIEMVMFYDNETSIRGDETLYSVPPPKKNIEINNLNKIEDLKNIGSFELNTLVMLTAPGGPSRIIQSPFKQKLSDGPLAMGALDYDDSGGVIFSGSTKEAGLVKVYAGEILVGETRVEAGGRWNFIAGNLLPIGTYFISAELVKDEAVEARISVPFERMAPTLKKEQASSPSVIHGLQSWQLSRPLLGGGIQHTVIFSPKLEVEEVVPFINVTE